MGEIYQSEQWLRKHYVEQGLKAIQMAEMAQCGRTTIYQWLEKYSIDRRKEADYRPAQLYHDADWLRQKYIVEKMSPREIAKSISCSRTIIRYWLDKHDIAIRNHQQGLDNQEREYSDSWRECWSIRMKKRWENGVYGSDEYIAKLSESAKERWANGAYDDKDFSFLDTPEYRTRLSKSMKEAYRTGRKTMVMHGPSRPHRHFIAALDICGIEHESEYVIPGDTRPYDEYIPRIDLLIEIDGVFWHHSEWAREHGYMERDRQKTKTAIDSGYKLLRYTDEEIIERGAWSIVAQDILPLLD